MVYRGIFYNGSAAFYVIVNSELRLVMYILVMPVCHQGYHKGHVPDHYYLLYMLMTCLIVIRVVKLYTVCLFADDTKLSRVLSGTEYRFELQEGLNDFMNWADQWQLRVAEHKCLVLSHGNCDPPSYYLKDVNLDNVDHHKDLGVIVDDHCLFKQHVSYICKKTYCSTNVLFRCFHTANTVALITGYKPFIRPVLEYCSTVWNPYTSVYMLDIL